MKMLFFRRATRLLAISASLLTGVSCAEESLTEPGAAPNGQTANSRVRLLYFPDGNIRAVVGSKSVVRVYAVDKDNAPVKGASVSWLANSGRMAPALSTTDATGLATSEWQAGLTAGAWTIGAQVASEADTVRNSIEGVLLAGPAARLVLFSGDGQKTIPNTLVPNPLIVKVLDASGNAVSGASVQWVADTASVITMTVDTSDAQGLVSASWQLGRRVGEYLATATLAGQQVKFTGTVVAATEQTPARIVMVDSARTNGQLAPVNRSPAFPYRVKVLDAQGRPVAGAIVKWEVGLGGGLVNPSQSLTDSNGEAAANRQYGPRSGTMTTIVSVVSVTSANNLEPVVFTGTAFEPAANITSAQSSNRALGLIYGLSNFLRMFRPLEI